MFATSSLKLSIVIVNYNVKHFLEQCLKSVNQSTKEIDAEIFVVDNNSVDGSNEMVKSLFPSVKLIANTENVGFSTANNQAIRQSTGDYVLLLNPDTVVPENCFSKLLTFADSKPDLGGCGVH
jgi:GT2 family glycosyltransferase